MLSNRLNALSLSRMDIFVTAAKHENFTKAANELFITQTSVSRNIQEIEENLGVTLFTREKGRVSLTPLGKLLYSEWSKILSTCENVLDKVYAIRDGCSEKLVIGDNNMPPAEGYCLPIIRKFEKMNPLAEVSLMRTDPETLIRDFLLGKFDAVFCAAKYIDLFDENNIKHVYFLDLPSYYIIGREHCLFDKETITVEDLEKQSFVVAKKEYPYYYNFIIHAFNELGFRPERIITVENAYTMALEIHMGRCITIADRFYTPFELKDIRYVEIENPNVRSGFVLAYSPENEKKCLKDLIKVTKDFAKETSIQTLADNHAIS